MHCFTKDFPLLLPLCPPTAPSQPTYSTLQSTCCHSLLHPHDLTSLSKLYTTPPHTFNSCRKFASPPQPLFENLLLVLLQLNNQPLRTHCAKTATVLPLKSQRKDILSLTYRTCLLLHQPCTPSYFMLPRRKTGVESKLFIHRSDTTKTSCILPSSDFSPS